MLIGDEYAVASCLGLTADTPDPRTSPVDSGPFDRLVPRLTDQFPNLAVLAATLRDAKSASRNDWGAVLWAGGQRHEAPLRRDLDILDRVGGGDGFVAGMAWPLLNDLGPQAAVDHGAARGALATTTPGAAALGTAAACAIGRCDQPRTQTPCTPARPTASITRSMTAPPMRRR